MRLRDSTGLPDGMGLGLDGTQQPAAGLPPGAKLFGARLVRPWAALALLGCSAGLGGRFLAPPAARPALGLLLDWLGVLLWFCALWLLPAFEELLARQAQQGLGGPGLRLGLRALGNSLLGLSACAMLALAPLAVLAAYNPRVDLLSFRDAESHLFSIGLGFAVFTMLLSGGTALVALSISLLSLLRCWLSRDKAIALWLALGLLLQLGVVSGNGWLATLGSSAGAGFGRYLLPGLGGLFRAWLAICLSADERYVYQHDLVLQLGRSVIAALGLALLALLAGQAALLVARPRGGRTTAVAPIPVLGLALWAGLLVPPALALGRAVWFARNPAATSPALPEDIALAAVLGLAGVLWLLAWMQPQAALARPAGAQSLRLLLLPLAWLGFCTPAIVSGSASIPQALWACASAAALGLAAVALCLFACALGSALQRGPLSPAGSLALLLSAVLVLVPAGLSGPPAARLLHWFGETLGSEAQLRTGLFALAAILLAALLLLWRIQRPLARRIKAGGR